MAAQHGHAHAGGSNLDAVVAEDLLGFDDHLPLFLGVALGDVVEVVAVDEDVDVGDAVEGDLMGEGFGLEVLAGEVLAGLDLQLLHALGTGARGGLVAAHDDAVDVAQGAQRLEGDDHLDGGAVGVGDDAVVLGDRRGVDLGDHQGDVGVDAEGGGVVDHDCAGVHDGLAELLGDGGACREQGDVNALEGLLGHLLDGELASGDLAAACEGELLAGGARRGEDADLGGGEVELLQALEHLAAHCSGGARNCDDGMGGHGFGPSHGVFLLLFVVGLSECVHHSAA